VKRSRRKCRKRCTGYQDRKGPTASGRPTASEPLKGGSVIREPPWLCDGRQWEQMVELKRTVAARREEIARLEGGPGRPNLKPSGMERGTDPKPPGSPGERKRRGAARDRSLRSTRSGPSRWQTAQGRAAGAVRPHPRQNLRHAGNRVLGKPRRPTRGPAHPSRPAPAGNCPRQS
jgi:hypothetical protein